MESKDVTPVSVGVKVDTTHDLDPNLLSFPKLITYLILPYVKSQEPRGGREIIK